MIHPISEPTRDSVRASAEIRMRPRGDRALSVIETIARGLAIFGCVFFALSAFWGMFGLIGAGHYAVMPSYGIIADNMLKWRTVGPVWSYVASQPSPSDWYCHHPFGSFWTTTILRAIFGRHDWLLPLPGILLSIATPPLLYKAAKEAWGIVPASAAVLGFVFLPITLAFGHYNALEVPGMFGFALFFFGHARMLATARRRYLLLSLLGAFFACGSDWAAWLVLAVILAWGMLRAFTLPRWMSPPIPHRIYASWWAWSVAIAVSMLALWVGLFIYAGKLSDWLGSGTFRSSGGGLSGLPGALEARKFWIESSFVPHTIFIGKFAAVVAFIRFLVYRRDAELYSLAILFGATFQYVVFKHGADIHIFWPHYFGAYYAVALAQLAAAMGDLARRLSSRISLPNPRLIAAIVALIVAAGPTLVLIPDGLRSLRFARETGGRFNERGRIIRSDMDALIVGRHIVSKLPQDIILDAHSSMTWGWHHQFATHRPSRVRALPKERAGERHPVYFARGGGLSAEEQRDLVNRFYVEIYDDIWVVYLDRDHAPLEGFTLTEREPLLWERYFISGVEPVRTISKDPFLTWELRHHLGQSANLPEIEPESLEQKRIAHNIALQRGDTARVEELRGQIERALSAGGSASFSRGVSIIGTRHIEGVKPRLEIWFHAAEKLVGAPTFKVHSVVEKKRRWSFIPKDPTERDIAYPMSLPPSLWQPGALYKHTITLRQRIGRERYFGWFDSRGKGAPRRTDGLARTDLIVLD